MMKISLVKEARASCKASSVGWMLRTFHIRNTKPMMVCSFEASMHISNASRGLLQSFADCCGCSGSSTVPILSCGRSSLGGAVTAEYDAFSLLGAGIFGTVAFGAGAFFFTSLVILKEALRSCAGGGGAGWVD